MANKLYVYNFNGTIYETYDVFDDTYRALMRESKTKGEPAPTRQIICGDKIINEKYHPAGIWLREE